MRPDRRKREAAVLAPAEKTVARLQGDITQPKMLGWGVADFLRDYANLFRASALENLALAPSGMQKAYKIKSGVQSSNPKHK